MAISQEAGRLKSAIERLLAKPQSDQALLDQLRLLKAAKPLPGLTWFWGPELYRRNRLQFLPFIMAHFSRYDPEGKRDDNLISWDLHASRLESWLQEVRAHRDSWLEQKLTRWKFSRSPYGIDEVRFCQELVRQFEEAKTKSARAQILNAFDSRFSLTKPVALALYQIDPSCSEFLQTHLHRSASRFRNEPREFWQDLFDAAIRAHDEDLAFLLYRWQVRQEEWQKDIERLASTIQDAGRLHEELRKRSPSGVKVNWHEPILLLLKMRGRDVFPYLRGRLSSLNPTQSEPLLELALARRWWDLWAGIIHALGDSKWFNKKILELLDRKDLQQNDRRDGLCELGSPTADWQDRPYPLWRTLYLDDAAAVRLYRLDPQLLKCPFKNAIVKVYDPSFSQLLTIALANEDHELVDLIASCYVRTMIYIGYSTPQHDDKKRIIDMLAPIYRTLRERNQTEFARRVSNILSHLPPHSLHSFSMLLARNALANLFFVEAKDSYLSAPEAIANLIEAQQPEVQILGFQVLALDDSRARWFVVLFLDLLLGALRRPLERRGLKALCVALANGARGDASIAERNLQRARGCLGQWEQKSFKEPLVGLLGRILFHHPQLRGLDEQPVIYLPQEVVP